MSFRWMREFVVGGVFSLSLFLTKVNLALPMPLHGDTRLCVQCPSKKIIRDCVVLFYSGGSRSLSRLRDQPANQQNKELLQADYGIA
jgi:hypothetical protein